MLIDVVNQYSPEKKEVFTSLRKDVVINLAANSDPKKIFSFLNKVWIVDIDENEKKVVIWTPNEFVYTQVKKFFAKGLNESIKAIYNEQYLSKFIVYTPFSNGSDLLIDLKKVLNIKQIKKEEVKTMQTNIKKDLQWHFGILFDPNYTFDSFIAGGSNEFAFSVAKAVAEKPWDLYNPLFLYGNVWLGKTHLMQAIGNSIISADPNKVILYLPCVKLIDEIIMAIRKNKLQQLIQKFDDVDLLIVDDIQFLADKDKTQEIFHNIFNDFHMKKKQVILSSDRPPKELMHIEPRLKSRFWLWTIVDIKSPDFETRIAILQSKLETKQEELDFEILSILAQNITSNVRELEWALNTLLTRQKLMRLKIDENSVYECLNTLWYSKKNSWWHDDIAASNNKSVQNFSTVVDMVCEYYAISVNEIKSDARRKEITNARQILMLIAKKYFNRTLEKIGDYFGGKNHASVIYAINNVERKLKTDKDVQHDYNVFIERI